MSQTITFLVRSPDGILAGMMGFKREYGLKLRHKGCIWGVYVSPAHRGKGLASLLLSEVIERGGIWKI